MAGISTGYSGLHANYQDLAGINTVDELTKTAPFQDFRAKLYFLFGAIIDTLGKDIARPWEIFFADTLTEVELRVRGQNTIRHETGAQISKHAVRSPRP